MHAYRGLKVPEIRSYDYLSEQITFSPLNITIDY